jgi:hypothetical protein
VSINHVFDDILFAVNTSILITDGNYNNIKWKGNLALSCLSKGF